MNQGPPGQNNDKMEGGAFGGADDLYREIILEHFRSPRNRGTVDKATATAEGVNPFCGDQIKVSALIEGDVIKDVKFDGRGCAISQSCASMMTGLLKGKTVPEARAFASSFKKLFGLEADENSSTAGPAVTMDDLGDLQALEGVKKFPVRIKCALLCWNTFLQGLKELK